VIAAAIAAVLLSIGGCASLLVKGPLREPCTVKVFFPKGTERAAVDAVRDQIAVERGVRRIELRTAAENLAEMERKYPEVTEGLGTNPLGPSLVVFTRSCADAVELEDSLEPEPPGVGEARVVGAG